MAGDELALAELIHKNKGLINTFTRKYRWTVESYADIDYDDLQQCGLIGLWQAATTWDPQKGSYSQIAIWQMGNELRRTIWKRNSAQQDGITFWETSLDKPIMNKDGEEMSLNDVVPDENERPAEDAENFAACHEFFSHLQQYHEPDPEDVEDLKRFVYDDWPPKDPKLFTRIKAMMMQSTVTRGWMQEWLDDRTTFITSQAFDEQGRSGKGRYSDPVAKAVIYREQLEGRLNHILWG